VSTWIINHYISPHELFFLLTFPSLEILEILAQKTYKTECSSIDSCGASLPLPFWILNVSSPVLEKNTNVGVIDFGNCIQFPELSLKGRHDKFYILADRLNQRLNSYSSLMLHLASILDKSIFVVHMCTNTGGQVPWATPYSVEAPNICGYSTWNISVT
jgi:hypothetical protein